MSKEYQSYKDYPSEKWAWPNFTPKEMASKGDGKLKIDRAAMNKLQKLRDALGEPMVITSAYRSPAHNAAVGGAKHSQHLLARAFDVQMGGHDPARFERLARQVGFTGFGFYPKHKFIHIDIGPPREWGKRWWALRGNPAPAQDEPTTLPRQTLWGALLAIVAAILSLLKGKKK